MNTNRTFAELSTAVATEMQLNPGLISATERKQFINNALADLGSINAFEKQATILTQSGVILLPDDCVNVIDVRWQENGSLIRPCKQTPSNVTGTASYPTYYYYVDDALKTIPLPSEDKYVTLTYRYRPAKLVNDGDKPDIPNGWDWLLVDYAVGFCNRKNGEIGLYREYKANYDTGRQDLFLELLQRANLRVSTVQNSDSAPASIPSYNILL